MGQEAAGVCDFKRHGETSHSLIFDAFRALYIDAELAYANMVACLGKQLIRGHHSELFE